MDKREQQPWRISKMLVRTGVSLRYAHITYTASYKLFAS